MATAREIQTIDGGALFEECAVIVSLSMSSLGNRAKVDTKKLVGDLCTTKMVHASKSLVKDTELRVIRASDHNIRGWLRKRTLSALLKDGMYLLALGLLADVDEKLQAYQAEREPLIDVLVLQYAERVAEAERELGPDLFDLSDYPGVERTETGFVLTEEGKRIIRQQFSVSYRYIEVSAPSKLSSISGAIYRREQRKAAQEMDRLAASCKATLRAELQGIVAHMIDRLSDGEDGKNKVFRSKLIPNFLEACDLLKKREITNDHELRIAVEQVEKLVQGIDAKEVRNFPTIRRQVADGFNKVKVQIDKLVIDAPDRYIELEDEDA